MMLIERQSTKSNLSILLGTINLCDYSAPVAFVFIICPPVHWLGMEPSLNMNNVDRHLDNNDRH